MRNYQIKLISLYNYSHRAIDTKLYLPYGLGVLTTSLRNNSVNTMLEDLSGKIENHNKKFWFSPKRIININLLQQEKRILDYVSGYSSDKQVECFAETIFRLTSFENYNLIGISVMTYFHFLMALLLSKKIKSHINTKIVFGGPFITLQGKELFHTFSGDYMIVGDGQVPLLSLIGYLTGRISVTEVPNLIYRKNGTVKANPRTPFPIENFSVPDFSDLSLDSYRSSANKKLTLPYLINNGCTHNCNFCNERLLDYSFGLKSYNKVITELKTMKERYLSNVFYFCDRAINSSYKYLDELCNIFIEEKLDIVWGSCARSDNLDRKILCKMKAAGCQYLLFGIESGSNRVLKMMNKGFTAEQASRVLRDSYQEGIRNYINLIVSYPHEQEADIEATVEFIKKNAKFIDRTIAISPLIIHYGSPLYNHSEKFGIKNLKPIVKNSAYSLNKHFTFDEIDGLKWEEKLKQQRYSYKKVLKTYFQYMLTKYYISFLPFWVYHWIRDYIDQSFGSWSFQLFIRFHQYFYRRKTQHKLHKNPTAFLRAFLELREIKQLIKKIHIVIKNRTAIDYFRTSAKSILAMISYNVEFKVFEGAVTNRNKLCSYNNGFIIGRITIDNIYTLENMAGSLLMNKFRQRIEEEKICFAVFYKNKAVAYSWIDCRQGERSLTGNRKLEEKEVYLFDSYVAPRYRKKGLYKAMCQKRLDFVAGLGYEKARVLTKNHFAEKTIKALEFTECGKVHYFKLFGIQKLKYLK